ncbi:hypothetical protein BRADI_1g38889v3 [Brachypodium distachyon]|uniref:Uncharacterized protein n=1 Tax=Brachypodium distachyon TaxID=15368 RepID=A0A2K2DNI6_BRADI|nr:hypothetical protein BRADI_1g38889v3 [Brachypodium distachyon]
MLEKVILFLEDGRQKMTTMMKALLLFVLNNLYFDVCMIDQLVCPFSWSRYREKVCNNFFI